MKTKPETKDQKWQERLREDLVKRLLLEGVEITMSVAKELDEFINVSVGKEIAKAREEMGEALRMKEKKMGFVEGAMISEGWKGIGEEIDGFNEAVEELNQKIDTYLKK